MEKVHRNGPCPCGSGRKAKRCCGGRPEILFTILDDLGNEIEDVMVPTEFGEVPTDVTPSSFSAVGEGRTLTAMLQNPKTGHLMARCVLMPNGDLIEVEPGEHTLVRLVVDGTEIVAEHDSTVAAVDFQKVILDDSVIALRLLAEGRDVCMVILDPESKMVLYRLNPPT